MRRVLLVAVTALVVARPLVLGEDPGMSAPQSDNGTLVLSLLWLLVGVGWAAWRLGARRGEWYVGLVEAGLGLAAVLFFISAATAANKHPARIIAWEWLILLVGFVVVRHLAATPDARHGLFAAFLATGLMIAVYGLYQAAFEIPAGQALSREQLRASAAEQGLHFNDATFETFYKRVQDKHAYSTFAHPNSYAGYLALLLPGFFGAAIVGLRNRVDRRITWLAAAVAALGMAALWTSHSRGALLGIAVVGVGVALLVSWRQLLSKKWVTLGIVAALGIAAVLMFQSGSFSAGLGKETGTMAARLDYWRATVKMIGDHPWLGVGPGNFHGYYPRYMDASAGEKIKDPHNFVLELWATGGAFVLLAVLVALGALFVCVGRGLHTSPERERRDEAGTESFVGRSEFYAGGVVGLLLGFVLSLQLLESQNQIVAAGIAAAARSVVWFLAFALFERIAWTDRQRVVALIAGIAALVLNLAVSGGISQPSVAGPLWFAGALALASLSLAPRVFSRAPLPSLGLPVPVLGATALIYVVFCFYPVSSSLSLMREAGRNGADLHAKRGYPPTLCARIVGLAAPDPTGLRGLACAYVLNDNAPALRDWSNKAPVFLETKVLKPLQEAALADPDNPRVWTRLGLCYADDWEFRHDRQLGLHAAGALNDAERRDPNGTEPLQAAVQMHLMFARYSTIQAELARRGREAPIVSKKDTEADRERDIALQTKRRKTWADMEKESRERAEGHLRNAIVKLRQAVKLDPTDAPLRFQLAELLDRAGDHDECRNEAAKALSFDAVSTHLPRRLSDPQRTLAKTWSEAEPDR
jgi:hypothetical protein